MEVVTIGDCTHGIRWRLGHWPFTCMFSRVIQTKHRREKKPKLPELNFPFNAHISVSFITIHTHINSHLVGKIEGKTSNRHTTHLYPLTDWLSLVGSTGTTAGTTNVCTNNFIMLIHFTFHIAYNTFCCSSLLHTVCNF